MENDSADRGQDASRIDWKSFDPGLYRYYFVRSRTLPPISYFAEGKCAPTLLKSSANWSVFENANCYSEPPGKQ
jgi:hypothetical protein